ncbi:hypothetical protein M9H77_13150 [Catharanthus roseus]|uniref:Uncharacterized protein n=1 Tax=Catharanthus roseus TaxID=4058 RepID=A0ACC0BJP2_CATRO|nr:hypothetical protein M9H77_13150 [Catharanthus roseus]
MSQSIQTLKKPPGYRDPNIPIQIPPKGAPNLPHTFYPYKKKRKSCCRTCCLCFCISLVLSILLFICLGGLFYVLYEPQLPRFNVKSFQLDQFNINESKDGPRLNTKLTVNIEFRNTNKKIKIVYDKISILVNGEGGLNIGEGTTPGFVQGKNNATNVKLVMKGNQLVSEQEAKKRIDEFKSKSLKLSTELRSGIGMILSGLNTGTVGLKVTCGDISLKQIENDVKPKCKVYMFRMLYIY